MSQRLEIETDRLVLVAGTAALTKAALENRERFAAILGASLDPDWPTPIVDGALTYFADTLAAEPDLAGWSIWYVLRKPDPGGARVIGSAGFDGRPDEGSVRVGFSIVEAHRGCGYATEVVNALIDWAFRHGAVRCWSQTYPDNPAAVRVMKNSRMIFAGEEEGLVIYERRLAQGPEPEG